MATYFALNASNILCVCAPNLQSWLCITAQHSTAQRSRALHNYWSGLALITLDFNAQMVHAWHDRDAEYVVPELCCRYVFLVDTTVVLGLKE